MIKELFAISNNPGEITLSGFTFMKDCTPDDFEVCLIVWNDGQISAGCWVTDSAGKGIFRQGRNGVIDAESILAWLPLEGSLYIEKNIWWNPEYHLIAEFIECFRVFAKDGDASLVFEYTGGSVEKVFFHMDAITGNIAEIDVKGYEDIKIITNCLKDWYANYKDELADGYKSGKYNVLSNYGEFE